VTAIDGTVFAPFHMSAMQIAQGNAHFRVSADFLLTFDGKILMHCFGGNSAAEVPREVEVLGKYSFPGH
jgi:hypothetical protein